MEKQIAETVEIASTEKEAMKRLRSLSECCICLMTYTDPRMLPCFHTACLKCFEDILLKNDKKPGDVLPCPLCRNEFPIPADGMKGLQRNFFIESLMEVTNVFNLENKSRSCTTCSMIEDSNDVAEATMRCLNCCENYCPRCSKIHKTLKATKDHQIVELNIEFKEEDIRNMLPIRKCVRHSDKVLDYYCSDCKTVVCVSCFVENHKTHECQDVTTVDKEFRQRIDKNSTKVNGHKEHILSKKFELEGKKKKLLAKTLKTESIIRKKNQELKALIDQHTEELLNELLLLKQRQEKKIDAEIEEIERKLTILESFMTFCTELKSKGSASEVCGSVDKLLTRANEINEENDEYLKTPSISFEFEFIATDHNSHPQNASNIIGKLSESTKDNRASNSYAVVIGQGPPPSNSIYTIKINLNRPEDVTTLEPLPDGIQWGAAAAVYRNSIFVCGLGNKYEEIWKLEATSSKWSKCASLIQGRRYHSVAFVDHVLYICGGWLDTRWTSIDDVETFNTYGDACSKVGKLAYAVSSSGNCVPYKASLYIFGGYDVKSKIVSNVQVYDTKLNTCTLLTNQMPRACDWLHFVLFKESVMLLGHLGCFLYNFDAQTWKLRDKFKLENAYSRVIVNDDKLFIIGCGPKKDEIRWITVANILNDGPTEWKHHAKLPNKYIEDIASVFAIGKLDLPL